MHNIVNIQLTDINYICAINLKTYVGKICSAQTNFENVYN